jgi:small GTP-binding protein
MPTHASLEAEDAVVITLSKKVCLLGDFAVGKTSLVRRFVYDRFDDKYISTIGVKVSRKTISLARDTDIVELTMMLWDLAGGEEFSRMRSSYLRGAAGALLVCDVMRPETLPSLRQYVQDLRDIIGSADVVLAANKADLLAGLAAPAGATFEAEVRAMATELQAPLYLTSAVDGLGVEAAFRHLGRQLAG